jgi:hypothetical protein
MKANGGGEALQNSPSTPEIIESTYEGSDIARVAEAVDEVYRGLGAKVIRQVSYAGEADVKLFIPDELPAERSEAMKAFINRPA